MIRRTTHLGFSLIELLLAIFILGIGVISIATLFPAGIAQQQKTTNDVLGPIVARNALTLLRSRVEQEDFGGAEAFDAQWSPALCGLSLSGIDINPWPTICGDWMWRRPAIVPSNYGSGNAQSLGVRGAIDIFSTPDQDFIPGEGPPLTEYWTDVTGLPGIPYNKERYPDEYDQVLDAWFPNPPAPVRIFASERQYPMWTGLPEDRPSAQYYWDCMFRRYEGRILVAIFVYRVVDPSQIGTYTIDTTGLSSPDFPRRVNLATQSSAGSWNAFVDSEILLGTEGDDPTLAENQWHYPGQWIVDQNGNVHMVQRGRRRLSDSNPVRLNARPAELPVFETGVNVHWWDKNYNTTSFGFIDEGVVTDIWFVPTRDSLGRKIIPVYATVQEL